MKSIIHILNENYRASAVAAEAIAEYCQESHTIAYVVDMVFNAPRYAELIEEWYNECVRGNGEERLQLLFSTMGGEQVLDLCEVHYMVCVLDTKDLVDMAIEEVERVMRGGE